MNDKFKKLAEKINYNITEAFQDAKILEAKTLDEKTFEVFFELPKIVPINEMKLFLEQINKIKYKTKVNFKIENNNVDINTIYDYIIFFITDIINAKIIADQLPKDKFKLEENQLIILCKTDKGEKNIQDIKMELSKLFQTFGFPKLIIRTQLTKSDTNPLEEAEKEYKQKLIKIQKFQKEEEKIEEVKVERKYGKATKVSISNAKDIETGSVVLEGEIFNKDIKTTKNGWIILEFSLTDYKDAIHASIFIGKEKERLEKYSEINNGTWIQAKGKIKINTFKQNEHEIEISNFKRIINTISQRSDDAPKKRVELNAKTLMSTMDGIVSPKDLLEKAKSFGHEAIAITDSDSSVQSFPELYNAAKGIKVIYGSTFNMIHKDAKIIYNLKDGNLSDQTYVVFDLETTGLSPINDEIIEFGATKVKNGSIIDKKQIFIKNTSPLSEFTKELTGINDEMLMDAINEEDAMKEIVDYFSDSILVAHNASFDMGFINEKIEKYNLENKNWTVVDTLTAARFQEPDEKRFSLQYVSKRNGYSYDTKIAHRADYDADILANTWMTMIAKFKRTGIETLGKLANGKNEKIYSAAFSKEVSILAKNNAGLKELFKLVSKSHTDNFYGSPKMFWDELPNSENLLIGSGGLKSQLVEFILRGTTQNIKDEIKKYDFIELQPLRNYAHEIARGNITEKRLINLMKLVIKEAKEQNIPVVATGDVHYLNDEDAIYHSVYINAKGLGGKRHHLFRYNEINPTYPIQSFLSTDEMLEAFEFLGDKNLIKEIVIDNTVAIANQIEKCVVIKDKLYTPTISQSDELLTDLVWKTAKEKYGETLPSVVHDRVEKELGSILKYGFGVIYYIAHQLVAKSLKDGYLVGSRGSVGSSVVATFAGITEVNPLPPHYVCEYCKLSEFPKTEIKCGYDLPKKDCPNCSKEFSKEGHNIPFETFLGFEANKVPDIDLNFSGDYQPIIHNEVKKAFGVKHAFRAGTISTVAEKTAYGYVKAWAEETGRSISKPFTEFLAKHVAGTKRTTGQHPGGIIVIPENFEAEDFSPINFPANDKNSSWKTTHFDFHAIHDNVLKLDLLGHDDPTAIKMLENLTGITVDKIPDYDERVISLFSSTKELNIKPKDISGEKTGAMGIPEFGTKFVRGMLKSVKVDSFADLVSISGLSHGTDVWTNNGELLVKNENKKLSELISCRDDIMSDLIDKGMDPLESFIIMEQVRKGKSINEEQEQKMIDANVEPWYIDSCKKIKYMFPKAHATAYVKMAWRIAWYKLYKPLSYYATYFTTRADVSDVKTLSSGKVEIKNKLTDFKARRYKRGEDKLTSKEESLIPILELSEELYARGFKIESLNLSKSLANDWVVNKENNSIIPPFSAIDGLGDSVAKSIIQARNVKSFSSIEDLKTRTNINKTTLSKFKELGVLDDMEETNQLTLF